jgi:hypothetical protein
VHLRVAGGGEHLERLDGDVIRVPYLIIHRCTPARVSARAHSATVTIHNVRARAQNVCVRARIVSDM